MRSVWLGVVAAVAAAGSAQAAQCVLVEKATQHFAGVDPSARPDLIGRVFTVTRTTSQRARMRVPGRDGTILLGFEAYELMGSTGPYVVRREYSATSPTVAAMSYAGGDEVVWRPSRDLVKADDYVMSGPLSDLVLKPTRCP